MYGKPGMMPQGMPQQRMQMPQQMGPQGGQTQPPQSATQGPMMPPMSREEISKMLGAMLQGSNPGGA